MAPSPTSTLACEGKDGLGEIRRSCRDAESQYRSGDGIRTGKGGEAEDGEETSGDGAADAEARPRRPEDSGDDPPPDGGFKAWSVIAGTWLVSFCTFGYINAFGVYQEYYQTHQLADRSASSISWIGSLQLCFVFMAGCVVGRLFDAGHLRILMAVGTVLTVLCIFMTSLAEEYWQVLLAQGVGLGLGMGVLYVPSVSCVPHWFRERRGFASGVLASGSSTGGIVFPIMLNKLIYHPSVGFAQAVRATGYVAFGSLVAANLLMRTRLPPKKEGRILDFAMLKEPTFAVFIMGAMAVVWGLYLPFFYLQTYALDKGVDSSLAFYSLAIVNASSVCGRVLPNYASDKVGPLNIMVMSCFFSGIMIFVFLVMSDAAGLVCFAIFFGFVSGAYVSVLPACVASLSRSMSDIGLRMGITFFMVSFPALTGTPIDGAIITRQGGRTFWGASLFSGLVVFAGTGLMWYARHRQMRVKGTWKV